MGDYELNRETMGSPPPDSGQLVVATPERIAAILRNSDFQSWIDSLITVVIDEAHLLADPRRGSSLEFVIAALAHSQRPPRLILLSATLGDLTKLREWLVPCDVVESETRSAPLDREIISVDEGVDCLDLIHSLLKTDGVSLLIFVYQTASAEKLARDLGGLAYHSRMSADARAQVEHAFSSREANCVVATTALAMGVNFPATHVLVRDLSRGPAGKVPASELMQMAGRAGRGTLAGKAIFVLKPVDPWTRESLVAALEGYVPEEINSSMHRNADEAVLAILAGKNGVSENDLSAFLESSFGESADLRPVLRWLSFPNRGFAEKRAELWFATPIGQRVIQACLPLQAATLLSRCIRTLLFVDPADQLLSKLTRLDLVILMELLAEKKSLRTRFSRRIETEVCGREWDSVLWRLDHEELVNSLGLKVKSARQTMILAIYRAKALLAGEIPETARADRLFFLGAISAIWDLACFSPFLSKHCQASPERLLRVSQCFTRLRQIGRELLDRLS